MVWDGIYNQKGARDELAELVYRGASRGGVVIPHVGRGM